MVERRTIRPEASVYERLNESRTELGATWDEYLTTLHEDHDHTQEATLSDEQVNEIVRGVADELEGRFR